MKDEFKQKNNGSFWASRLSKEHWQDFKRFYTNLENPQFFTDELNYYPDTIQDAQNNTENWKKLFDIRGSDESNTKIFGLWHKDKIVGMTTLELVKPRREESYIVFSRTQIADNYLKQNLTPYLHQVKLDYIKNNTENLKTSKFRGKIRIEIDRKNERALKAVKNTDFVENNNHNQPSSNRIFETRLPGFKKPKNSNCIKRAVASIRTALTDHYYPE